LRLTIKANGFHFTPLLWKNSVRAISFIPALVRAGIFGLPRMHRTRMTITNRFIPEPVAPKLHQPPALKRQLVSTGGFVFPMVKRFHLWTEILVSKNLLPQGILGILSSGVDDAAMHITEAVRGADLLVSTARQILLYRALGLTPPEFFHCALMQDEKGVRLAKRHDALSLRTLRGRGETPRLLRQKW
jgi:hypothetical protein